MSLRRLAMVGIVLVSLTTAACGGGGGGGGGGSVPSTPTPVAAPTAQAVTATAGGVTANLNVTTGAGSVAAQATTANPAGTTTLALRRPASLGTSLVYITLSASQSTTITAIGGTFTLASPPAQSVFLAYWNGSAWASASSTPATVSGLVATFATVTLSPVVTANPTAFFAIYTGTAPLVVPTSTPTSTPTPSPVPSGTAFVDTACTQTMATATNTITSVTSTFFSTIVPNAHTICISAWDLSSDIDTALASAIAHGASVTVITPMSENSSNAMDIAAIVAAGGHAKTEYTGSPGTSTASIAYQHAAMDIHAKFALVDGVAYMDGHNWFTTDVVLRDGYAADFNAVQSDLVNFPASPPNGDPATKFTTDKQVSLKSESDFLQNVAIPALNSGGANEYDFITESFNPNNASGDYNDDVYTGICQISQLVSQPTMKLVLEEESGYSTAARTALQNLLTDPNAVGNVRSNSNGHEKISMIRMSGTPVAAWFGSSNATTTDLFDWGMTTTDPTVLAALATYFDTVEFAHATAISGSAGAPACGTLHS
jgi:hypothetical protein